MRVVKVPGDGHCLFHAICQAMYTPYIDGEVDRTSLVVQLRADIAEYLQSTDSDGVTQYDKLGRGYFREFANNGNIPEFTMEYMVGILNSSSMLGFGYMELISNYLDIDIYVLSTDTQDLYVNNENRLYQRRDSIILLNNGKHYDVVGVKNGRTLHTYFSPSHRLIKRLRRQHRKLTTTVDK